ncbi:MAG: phosphatase PAP2 family protein [Clostridia bacterium]|nr:phosphatase PAP2 family protein [Clostridia bacterium]
MKYDYKTLYEKNATFLKAVPLRKRLIQAIDMAVTLFVMIAYLCLIMHAINAKIPTTDFVALLFVPFLGLFIATVLQIAIDRPRPFSESGAAITPMYKRSGDGKSFPSRHMTSAFVIATVCLPHLPAFGAVLYVLSLFLGYARFSLGWHYPSDLFAGAGLGVGIGCLIFFL